MDNTRIRVHEQEPTEFGQRAKAMLRTTWVQWQVAQIAEQEVRQQLVIERGVPHETEGAS